LWLRLFNLVISSPSLEKFGGLILKYLLLLVAETSPYQSSHMKVSSFIETCLIRRFILCQERDTTTRLALVALATHLNKPMNVFATMTKKPNVGIEKNTSTDSTVE
jgi:hypothetical protein